MFIFDKINAHYKTFTRNKLASYRRTKINKTNFTIISNNCWGGGIYESYGIIKQSPTVGMFILPSDYLKFIGNIKYYLNQKLNFIDPFSSKNTDFILKNIDRSFGNYPVGVLNDIEIYFMHYKDERTVEEKWKRRIKRISWDHIIYKFNDQNGCTDLQLKFFDEMNLPNKVAFTVRDGFENCRSIVKINNPGNKNYVEYSNDPFGANKFFNVNNFINRI